MVVTSLHITKLLTHGNTCKEQKDAIKACVVNKHYDVTLILGMRVYFVSCKQTPSS